MHVSCGIVSGAFLRAALTIGEMTILCAPIYRSGLLLLRFEFSVYEVFYHE